MGRVGLIGLDAAAGEPRRMNNELLLGDCLDLMGEIPSGSVDMILADLPYNKTRCHWDSLIPIEPLWAEYRRVIKRNGAILLFGDEPFASGIRLSNPKMYRYDWVWEKGNATGHLNAKKMPMRAHESIMVFYQRLPTYNPKITYGHKEKESVKRHDNGSIYGAQKFEAISYCSTARFPRSVLRFPSDKQKVKLHPTQKPLALCEYLIETYTNPGEVVLDNCMGSGTTGVAAANTGRSFIGTEKDAEYYEIAAARIASAVEAAGMFMKLPFEVGK